MMRTTIRGGDSGSDRFGALFIRLVGLPFGTLVLPITIPCGVAWTFVVRLIIRDRP